MPLLQQPNCQRTSEPANTQENPGSTSSAAAWAEAIPTPPSLTQLGVNMATDHSTHSPSHRLAAGGKHTILAKTKHSSRGCFKNKQNNQPRKPTPEKMTPDLRKRPSKPPRRIRPRSRRQSGSTAASPNQPRPDRPNATAFNITDPDATASQEIQCYCTHGAASTCRLKQRFRHWPALA